MSNIFENSPLMGIPSRQHSLPEFRSAAYEKEVSVRAQESLSTGIVIETAEGDKVTLSSSSFSHMDAYMYDSKGMVQTEGGSALFSKNVREITLASGKSFSFAVEGDLNEEELEDIESLLQGLDGVIAEVKEGDVSEAMEKALGIGSFESISSYSAEIRYQSSYELSSSIAAATTQVMPETEAAPEPADTVTPYTEPEPAQVPEGKPFFNGDTLFEKLLQQFENREEKLLGHAKNPINNLFQHHLDEMASIENEVDSIFAAVENAMNTIDSMIEEMIGSSLVPEVETSEKPVEE